jgi:hypothetical protein
MYHPQRPHTPTSLPSAHDQRVHGGSARGKYPLPLCPYHARNEAWWQVPVAQDLFVTVTPRRGWTRERTPPSFVASPLNDGCSAISRLTNRLPAAGAPGGMDAVDPDLKMGTLTVPIPGLVPIGRVSFSMLTHLPP